MGLRRVSRLWIAAALSTGSLFAVTAPIGVASALGTFTLDDAKVEGNANLFDGARISTSSASSHVYLTSGTMLTLGINSAAKFYKDHLSLDEGAARVMNMNHYGVQAAGYRVESSETGSEAVIRLSGDEVQIAALSGALNVRNDRGVLLSRVTAGTASAFRIANDNTPANGNGPAPQAGQSGATAGTAEEAAKARRHSQEKLFLILGTSLAGLGLAVDAILQPGSPTSP